MGRFFSGYDDTVWSRAKNTTWRGTARAEISLTDHIELLTGFCTEPREISGDALLGSVFVDSTTFSGRRERDRAAQRLHRS